ncbi:MAG: oligoendopeptidase F [Candidatus Ureaplasma intestinipullorum]|uniref:Oligopeptidase F n=1 Tax=Candidatus Ureaplasma intestinipullorum TaxID=2838770 RepID=A0A9E2KXR0_9BACT|nr:oligoendopeptidase F [Candidatus Ureaplasma intestinipullorum]
MENKYVWDLDDILESKTLDDLYLSWKEQMEKLIKIYNDIFISEENFINWIEENDKFDKLLNRLYNYISNNQNEDLSSPIWNSWVQKLSNDTVEFSNIMSNYSNLVIKNESKIIEYLKNDKISEYKREFDLIFKNKDHLLSDSEEKIMAQLNRYSSGFEDIYSVLTDNDLTFEDALDSNGNKVEIKTQSDIFKNLKSTDRKLRETSWLSFHKAFYNFRNTLTKTLYYNYLMLNTNAKARKFEDYIDRTCFDDEVDKKFIQNIYKNIKTYSSSIYKYQEIRNKYLKHLLNIEEVKPWDTRMDLYQEKNEQYSLENIIEETKNALSVLGDEYVGLLNKAFEERWISFLPNPNKQTGAYSIGGIKGLRKYFISMNFDNTINSLYTLVHELGHSINSYYIVKNQKVYVGNSIFYAEIASITNEMLLSHYLLKKHENNVDKKIMILDELISGFIATTSRQVIFSNFEWIANEWVNNGSNFVYENIESTYLKLMQEYLGIKNINKYESIPYLYSLITPLRISHFYIGNFYVYKYAIGQIAAVIVANKIANNDQEMKKKYFEFLSSGNSLNPIDTIKILGIDFEDPNTWIEVNNIFNSWLNEFEKLITLKLNKK